jgi:hypothetical protein
MYHIVVGCRVEASDCVSFKRISGDFREFLMVSGWISSEYFSDLASGIALETSLIPSRLLQTMIQNRGRFSLVILP